MHNFLSFKIILKNSFRTTNCEPTAKLEQMFFPKGEGGGGHPPTCAPLPTFEGGVRAPPLPLPPFSTPVQTCHACFFFNWHVFPEFIPFEVNGRLFILSVFNKFDILLKIQFLPEMSILGSGSFFADNVSINDISVIHVAAH